MPVSRQVRLNDGKRVDDVQPPFVEQQSEGYVKLVANNRAGSRRGSYNGSDARGRYSELLNHRGINTGAARTGIEQSRNFHGRWNLPAAGSDRLPPGRLIITASGMIGPAGVTFVVIPGMD